MLGYILILAATLCFTGQFVFTKLYERAIPQTRITSLVMLLISNLIGVVMFGVVGNLHIHFSLTSIIWAVLLGIVMIPCCMLGLKVLSLGSLAIYSMFMMLGGMIVPFVYGVLFLHEAISFAKILGIVLLTVFIILQSMAQKATDDTKTSKKGKRLFITLCLLIFFLNGFTSVITKAHQISNDAVDEVSFTVISCLATLIISMIMLFVEYIKNRSETKKQTASVIQWKPILTLAFYGAAAYTGSFLNLKAASSVPASIQFPIISGGVIFFSALASVLIFREKISKKEWISIMGALISILFFIPT